MTLGDRGMALNWPLGLLPLNWSSRSAIPACGQWSDSHCACEQIIRQLSDSLSLWSLHQPNQSWALRRYSREIPSQHFPCFRVDRRIALIREHFCVNWLNLEAIWRRARHMLRTPGHLSKVQATLGEQGQGEVMWGRGWGGSSVIISDFKAARVLCVRWGILDWRPIHFYCLLMNNPDVVKVVILIQGKGLLEHWWGNIMKLHIQPLGEFASFRFPCFFCKVSSFLCKI